MELHLIHLMSKILLSLLTRCCELTHIPESVHRWKKLEDMQKLFIGFLAFPGAKGPSQPCFWHRAAPAV